MKQKILLALGCVLMASGTWATSYTLTLYADGCESPNTFICSEGQELSVSATPMEHRHFVMWYDGNTDNPRLVTMNQNYTYTATFAPDSFNISLSASPTSYGSVSGAGRYQYNSTARLSATANYGYKFSKWNDGNTSNPRTITVTEDKTYTATFVKQSYSISVASSNTSWGSVSGAGTYDYLSNVTINATPSYGYHFVQWNDGNTNSTRTISVTESKSYTATFAKNTYTISATSNNTTYGTVSGGGSALYLSSKQLTATAKYGYHFVKWNDGNTANPRTITVERDSSFVAEFAPNQYQCNVTCNNTRGSVYVNGEGLLNADFVVKLTDEYGDGWNGNKLTITDGTHSYDCTISNGETAWYNITYYGLPYTFYWTKGNFSGECSFEVTCKGNTYSVADLSEYKTGDIVKLPLSNGAYDFLSELTLTATPNYGYHFTQWSDGNTDNPRSFIIICDTTFTMEFAPNEYSIATSAATEGGTTKGDTIALYQDSVTITATADYGYDFYAWQDGNSMNPRTITVTEDKEYVATFRKHNFDVTVASGNSTMGTVSGSGSTPYKETRTIFATAFFGYEFAQWNDGNTDNPRSVLVESDSTFVAYFQLQKSGKCGANLTWRYEEGVMYVQGTGNMYDYTSSTMPWLLLRDSITSLSLDNDVTSIGAYAFYGCQNRAFRTLTLPQTLIKIGKYAFANCNRLTSINFGNDLEEVGDYAFSGCTRINDMTIYATITPDAYDHTFDGVNTMAYLYVQPNSVRTYKLDPIWGVFDIQGIGATTTTTDDVVVTPSYNDATITWPADDNAATYTIVITKDGEVFCRLVFNSNGQLTGIAFAKAADGERPSKAATSVDGGWQFTVTGLNPGTKYGYEVTAKSADNTPLNTYTGTFETEGGSSVATDISTLEFTTPTKRLVDGQLLITREGKTYNAQGTRIE